MMHFGARGRYGLMQQGVSAAQWLYFYPEPFPGSYVAVIHPSPYPDVPGDIYFDQVNDVNNILVPWSIVWVEVGDPLESRLREEIGWPDLTSRYDGLGWRRTLILRVKYFFSKDYP